MIASLIIIRQAIMAGLDRNTLIPTEIKLHQKSRLLEIGFPDGSAFKLPYEFLRVYSPSAEVRGHGPGQEVLQTGKREVVITAMEPVGNYAVKPTFSDGHDTGIYSWDLLHHLCTDFEAMWQQYLERISAAGASRDLVESAQSGQPAAQCASGGSGGCGHAH
jgi:DUF971 family protein